MGLDAYLYKEEYIAGTGAKGKITYKSFYTGKQETINVDDISYVATEVAYWRKANHIHKWFVDNVQHGIDDCGKYRVTYEQLMELLDIAEETKKTNNPSLLSTTSGFFFGSTEYDDWYWASTDKLISVFSKLKQEKEKYKFAEFYYSSSW